MKIERVYLCGPMTGYPDLNVPRFREVVADLEAIGFNVAVPIFQDGVTPESLRAFDEVLRLDIQRIMTCDAVVTLEGWANSRGSREEVRAAIGVGIPVVTLPQVMQECVELLEGNMELWSHRKP